MAARRDPMREWRERFARGMHSIDFRPMSDGRFHASIVPVLNGVHTSLSAGFTFRDDELIRSGGGEEAFSLVIARSRNLEVAQVGRAVRLGRGDATLLHVSEIGHVGSHNDFEFIAQVIPASEVADRGVCLDAAVACRLPARTEALQLLRGYIGSAEKRKSGISPSARALIGRHVADLAALAFSTDAHLGETALSAVVAARLAVALDHIAEHFQEPEFNVASAARSQGISPRYLQRLIETSGKTFTAHVNELRLQQAFTLLTEITGDRRRIADIALEVGFSDISQFNRLFRARFGDTPSAVRTGRRAAEAGLLQDTQNGFEIEVGKIPRLPEQPTLNRRSVAPAIRIQDFVAWPGGPAIADELPWETCANVAALVRTAIAGLTLPYRRLREGIAVHETATIEEGAILKPPCIIGAGCFVAAYAYLRDGVWLGEGVVIGPSVEIKSSFIGANSNAAHFNFVGNSILGAGVNLEAGAILANYRNESADKEIVCVVDGVAVRTGCEKFGALVGDGCRIGANAVLAPGTILSRGTVVPRLKLIDQVAELAARR